jgi:hypothetical protein
MAEPGGTAALTTRTLIGGQASSFTKRGCMLGNARG